MRNIKHNILVEGLLKTGSSALVDLLREYDNIKVSQREFDDYRAPGLVADQLSSQQSLEFINRIDKIARPKSIIKLIYNIFPIFHWRRISTIGNIRGRFLSVRERNKQLKLLKELNNKLTSTISFEEKINFANQWISDVGNINSKNKDFVVFDQPLLTNLETHIWKEVFNPWKLIIIFRDPKDQLADIIKSEYLYAPYGAPYMNFGGATLETIYGRNRKGAINFHIDAIKKNLEWVDMLKKELNPDQFLLIDFEGLVNNYKEYKNVIEAFIGNIKPYHNSQKLYFDPLKAKENINIYKDYLKNNEIESIKEIDEWYTNMIRNNRVQM